MTAPAPGPYPGPHVWLARAVVTSVRDFRRDTLVADARAAGRMLPAEVAWLQLGRFGILGTRIARLGLEVRPREADPWFTTLDVFLPAAHVDAYKPGRTLLVAHPDAEVARVVLPA